MTTEQQAPELRIKDRYQIENEIEDGDFSMMWATLPSVQARDNWIKTQAINGLNCKDINEMKKVFYRILKELDVLGMKK